MAVQVNVTATLRNLVGAKSVEVEGGTVGEVLANLEARFPGFKSQISDGSGGLHRFVNIYLNDEDIRYLNALDTKLKAGDVVSILPALAGGALCCHPEPSGAGVILRRAG
jgi:molybdopterin synthase sulfur carrier subunit